MAASSEGPRTPVFCYGSNNIEQIRSRCKNPWLQSEPALLRGWVRVFAGDSSTWGGGGVASVVPVASLSPGPGGVAGTAGNDNDKVVYGSIVRLSRDELHILDWFEGCLLYTSPSPRDS